MKTKSPQPSWKKTSVKLAGLPSSKSACCQRKSAGKQEREQAYFLARKHESMFSTKKAGKMEGLLSSWPAGGMFRGVVRGMGAVSDGRRWFGRNPWVNWHSYTTD